MAPVSALTRDTTELLTKSLLVALLQSQELQRQTPQKQPLGAAFNLPLHSLAAANRISPEKALILPSAQNTPSASAFGNPSLAIFASPTSVLRKNRISPTVQAASRALLSWNATADAPGNASLEPTGAASTTDWEWWNTTFWGIGLVVFIIGAASLCVYLVVIGTRAVFDSLGEYGQQPRVRSRVSDDRMGNVARTESHGEHDAVQSPTGKDSLVSATSTGGSAPSTCSQALGQTLSAGQNCGKATQAHHECFKPGVSPRMRVEQSWTTKLNPGQTADVEQHLPSRCVPGELESQRCNRRDVATKLDEAIDIESLRPREAQAERFSTGHRLPTYGRENPPDIFWRNIEGGVSSSGGFEKEYKQCVGESSPDVDDEADSPSLAELAGMFIRLKAEEQIPLTASFDEFKYARKKAHRDGQPKTQIDRLKGKAIPPQASMLNFNQGKARPGLLLSERTKAEDNRIPHAPVLCPISFPARGRKPQQQYQHQHQNHQQRECAITNRVSREPPMKHIRGRSNNLENESTQPAADIDGTERRRATCHSTTAPSCEKVLQNPSSRSRPTAVDPSFGQNRPPTTSHNKLSKKETTEILTAELDSNKQLDMTIGPTDVGNAIRRPESQNGWPVSRLMRPRPANERDFAGAQDEIGRCNAVRNLHWENDSNTLVADTESSSEESAGGDVGSTSSILGKSLVPDLDLDLDVAVDGDGNNNSRSNAKSNANISSKANGTGHEIGNLFSDDYPATQSPPPPPPPPLSFNLPARVSSPVRRSVNYSPSPSTPATNTTERWTPEPLTPTEDEGRGGAGTERWSLTDSGQDEEDDIGGDGGDEDDNENEDENEDEDEDEDSAGENSSTSSDAQSSDRRFPESTREMLVQMVRSADRRRRRQWLW